MHYTIIGLLIGIIVIIQITIFSDTLKKIKLFKAVFPGTGKFSLIKVFIGEDKIEKVNMADLSKDLQTYTRVPSDDAKRLLTFRIDGKEEFVPVKNFEKRITQNSTKNVELLLKKNNRSMYVPHREFETHQLKGWTLVEKKQTCFEITLINHDVKGNQILTNILHSVNTYLLKNKGAISDFNLVKDIVERNCDAADEEINTQLPVPLYLGLIGTMIGIVIGVGYMAFRGFDSLLDVHNGGESNGIIVLMGGVGVAMISSLIGLSFTTIASGVFYKGAKSLIESSKNLFYTFIQTELLPTISGSVTNSIVTLQTNLMKFNDGFTGNITRFDELLSQILNSFNNQTQIVRELKNIDFVRLAKSNVAVLQQLNKSAEEFEKFNQYLQFVNELVSNASQLNDTLKSDLADIENRKQEVSRAFLKVNDSFEKGLTMLKQSTDDRLDEVKKATGKQQDAFEEFLKENQSTLKEIVDSEKGILMDQLNQNREILAELKKQSELRQILEKIEKTIAEQNKQISSQNRTLSDFRKFVDELRQTVNQFSNSRNPSADQRLGLSKPLIFISYVFVTSGALIGIGFIGYKLFVWIEKLTGYFL